MKVMIEGKEEDRRKIEGVLKYNATSKTYLLQFESPATKTIQRELGYPKTDTKIWLFLK